LSALRAFEATARHASFSLAAEELNISKSAVSHQVRLLEELFGVALLRRGRVVPTAEGRILQTATVEALATLGQACEVLARGRRRRLTVSANAPFSALWLAPRIARFAAAHPDIDIAVKVMDGLPDWTADGVDLAILRTREPGVVDHDSATVRRADDVFLLAETVFPVCSPLLAIADPAHLAQQRLLQEDHAASPEIDWRTWFALMQLGAVPAGLLVRFSGFSLAISAAVAGAGVALGRSPLIDDELAAGRLVRLFPEYEIPGSWQFVLRPRPGHDSPQLQALCAFLCAEAGTTAP
jgi:LysR family glycine cleavage system transcriptional activator